jgi:pimeloyl-ACP methyl ester carboxylesterase
METQRVQSNAIREAGPRVSEFERTAAETMVRMSDKAEIRVLHHPAPTESRNGLSMLFIGGWSTGLAGWDFATVAFAKNFDVYYLETREKHSSVLHADSVNDLTRLSKDLCETVDHFGLDQSKLVVFGSSWGGVIAAQALADKRMEPMLTVFRGPIARFRIPPLTRYVVPIVPPRLFEALKPLLRTWLIRRRAETPEQAAFYLEILEDADPVKWKSVGRHIATSDFRALYSAIDSPTLVISTDSGDKFHTDGEAHRIAALMRDCGHVTVRDFEEMNSPVIVEFVRAHLADMAARSPEAAGDPSLVPRFRSS